VINIFMKFAFNMFSFNFNERYANYTHRNKKSGTTFSLSVLCIRHHYDIKNKCNPLEHTFGPLEYIPEAKRKRRANRQCQHNFQIGPFLF
jgi:hypothetical protein